MLTQRQIRKPWRPRGDQKHIMTCCILAFFLLGTVTLAESEVGGRSFQTPPPPPPPIRPNLPNSHQANNVDPIPSKTPLPPPLKPRLESTTETHIRPPPPPLRRTTLTESRQSPPVRDTFTSSLIPPPPPRSQELPNPVKEESEFRLQLDETSTDLVESNHVDEEVQMTPSEAIGRERTMENKRLKEEHTMEPNPVDDDETVTDDYVKVGRNDTILLTTTESQSDDEKSVETTLRGNVETNDMRLDNGRWSTPADHMHQGQDQLRNPPPRPGSFDDTAAEETPIQSLPQPLIDDNWNAGGPHPHTRLATKSGDPTSRNPPVYVGPTEGHGLPQIPNRPPPHGFGRAPPRVHTGFPPPAPNQPRPSIQPVPRRPPPSGRMPPSSSSSSSSISSTWKLLWGKVEKSLDGLAKVEDSITERAQQIFSNVASTPLSITSPPKSLSQEEITRIARERSAKVTPPTKTPLTPYGNKFDVIMKKPKEEGEGSTPPSIVTKSKHHVVDSSSSRQINWNNIMTGKMIRANGGASSPDGQHPIPPTHPSMYMPPPDAIQPLPPNNVPPMESFEEQPSQIQPQSQLPLQSTNIQSSGQYVANPYMQSSHLTSPPKQPSIAADTHSRSSRIPWDTSKSSSMKYSTSPKRPNPSSVTPSVRPDYDVDKSSFLSKVLDAIPSLPRMPNPLNILRLGKKSSYQYANMDAWRDDDDEETAKRRGFLFGFFRAKSKSDSLPPGPTNKSAAKSGDALAPPLKSLLARCDGGKNPSLLLSSDEIRCRTLGRYQAFFDGLCVFFVLVGIQQVDGLRQIAFPPSLEDFIHDTLPRVFTSGREALFTWAPIFAGYAYLSIYAKRRLLTSRVERLVSSIASAVEDESQYAQLYLRLAAAIRMDPALPKKLNQAAMWQVRSVVATSRLNSFVTMVVASLIVMTVTVIGPFLTVIGQSLWELFVLDEWRSWPIPWTGLVTGMRHIVESLALTLEELSASAFTAFLENPMQFAFHLSIIASSLLITVIPNLEVRRKTNADKDDDDDDVALSLSESSQQFAKLGASSATRLTMLSENGSIENALERWRSNRVVPVDESSKGALLVTIRHFAYTMLAAVTAMMPIVFFYLVGMASVDTISHFGLKWDSVLDVSVVLLGMFGVANNAIRKAILFCKQRSTVKTFVSTLSNTIDEIRETNRRQADIQFMAVVSPTAGLVVKDLWAAHTTKRAWAVRGANLQCKNGELLVLLGDDGAGKTRILTAIAESLISPPRRSLTTNKVRGFVGVGGVESGKWDKSVLKRRLGVLLSDVRTVADTASLYSGWNMEEILEPVDGLRLADVDHKLSSSEKSSILLALKITGLYSTLIPRLPSKLSTVLTANEEDLRPSALRPRSQVLSPAEWSKLILAKVLAQTIYDNENAAASTDKIENCMVGSVLLLDDPTVLLSEVEEAKILKELRLSGAATIMATNKWATGRFADHIVVVRDGAIVESGTHNDLISRGPQQSLYAAKWHAMTTQ